jgi:hypothetical protein
LIYKYLQPERLDVLNKLRIRATPFNQLNDPFECKFILNPQPGESDGPDEDERVYAQIEAQVATESRFGQFGILCFSRRYDCMPLWAHYASNHKGYLIGFDEKNKMFDSDAPYVEVPYRTRANITCAGFGSLRDVDYCPRLKAIEFGGNIPFDSFFQKHPDWQYEAEVRIFRSLSHCAAEQIGGMTIHLLEIPADAVKEVIIGANGQALVEGMKQLQLEKRFENVAFKRATIKATDFGIHLYDL